MGQIPNSAVIVLCIVGAGAAILIGYAIGHKVRNQDDQNEEYTHAQLESGAGFTQYEYMYVCLSVPFTSMMLTMA